MMRNTKDFLTECVFKKRRSSQNCLLVSAFMFLSVVTEAEILPTKEENATNAKISTTTAMLLSMVFCGKTSMLAGVNCVSVQCKLVVYWYPIEALSISLAMIQFGSLTRFPSVPTKNHKQAMQWFSVRMKNKSFTRFNIKKAVSELIVSWICAAKRFSFKRRRSRAIRTTRKDLANSPTAPIWLTRCVPSVFTQSAVTTAMSRTNHVVR
mmetsp:Transcript_8286/g.19485  ORF Transcript_8286/g.19485 Transcript_8286/m.19485 type:complete len:209 (+) Transcript_8286:975-1601(+)